VILRTVRLALVAAFLVAACGRRAQYEVPMPEVAFVTIGPNELEHVIRLASATVASGDTIHSWSVIRNAGGDTLSLTISDDLFIGGTLALGFPRDLVELRSAGREQ
jgi:hypothetical protein